MKSSGVRYIKNHVNLPKSIVQIKQIRNYSSHLKDFEEIPGPKGYPVVGTLPLYLPYIGKYSFKRLHWNGFSKYKEFGPLVRETIGNDPIVWIFDPKDIEAVYANDGKYPKRASHLALQKYRLDRPDMYSSGGLLPTNGEEWWRIRKASQKIMTRMPCVRSHLPSTDEIARDFTDIIGKTMDPKSKEIKDVLTLLKRTFLEFTVMSSMNKRLGCLKTKEMPEEAKLLIEAADMINKAILTTDNSLRLWRYIQTPLYKQIIKGEQHIYKTAVYYVNQRINELENKSKNEDEDDNNMLDYFLLHSGLDFKDIITIISDTLLAGIDTGSYTIAFLLYNLSTNLEVQEKLQKEANELLPNIDSKVTVEVLSKAKYTKAVLKESLRMFPVSIGVGRIAGPNLVLSGYKIPEGTTLVTQNQVSCRLPEYFENPNEFIPERWLERNPKIHPFLILPFGHGPRSCIGRRLADQNMLTLILHLAKEYKMEWVGKILDCHSNLINEPDSNIEIKFSSRNNYTSFSA